MRLFKFVILFFFIPAVVLAGDDEWDFLDDWNNAVESEVETREAVDANIRNIRAMVEDPIIECIPTIWPCAGRITSGFGYRTHPRYRKKKFHAGVDIANKIGTPVVAPGGGRVIYTGWHIDLGWYIKIRHTKRVITKMGHLKDIYVKIGDEVKRGEIIGSVGTSGWVTGPHTHYEIRIDGVAVNPRDWMMR